MYKALKSAQSEVSESLLKLADEIMSANQGNAGGGSIEINGQYDAISSAIKQLHMSSSQQFQTIAEQLKELNANMLKIAGLLTVEKPAVVSLTTTIPNIQPVSSEKDMLEKQIELDTSSEEDNVSLEELEVEEVEEEIEVEEEVEEEEANEVEVEEWYYKGRSFFKDSNNVVYANDGGEVGDAIGTYDPIKMSVRKINN
jgi:hypothetical protein